MVHPVARVVVGLVTGFGGATAAISGSDWLGEAARVGIVRFEVTDEALADHCARSGLELVAGTAGQAAVCGGRIEGLWRTVPIDLASLCRTEFGGVPRQAETGAWQCALSD